MIVDLDIQLPRWAVPLEEPSRLKGAKGGRAGGKSWYFAERVVERMVTDPEARIVSIREVQKSLKYSAKTLIENTIRKFNVEHLFTIREREIRRRGGRGGICIFEGMQAATEDSIKSLEGFDIAWIEEAQRISERSLKLLIPTIRADGSELWFSWNPDQPEDPIENLLRAGARDDAIVVEVNYTDNPWCPQTMIDEANHMKRVDPEGYEHIWRGQFDQRSEAQVFAGKFIVDEFEPQPRWDGPYYGGDWGFANDPTVAVKVWVDSVANTLYVEYGAGGVGIDMDDIKREVFDKVPGMSESLTRSDCARPETISYLNKNHGLNVIAAPKWSGSVKDGIAHMRKYDRIVIHERCKNVRDEFRHYRYKTDRLTGDVRSEIFPANDHYIDAIRYALSPLIKAEKQILFA